MSKLLRGVAAGWGACELARALQSFGPAGCGRPEAGSADAARGPSAPVRLLARDGSGRPAPHPPHVTYVMTPSERDVQYEPVGPAFAGRLRGFLRRRQKPLLLGAGAVVAAGDAEQQLRRTLPETRKQADAQRELAALRRRGLRDRGRDSRPGRTRPRPRLRSSASRCR